MRYCKHAGCPNLVTSGYCEQHSQSGRLCLEPHCPNKAVEGCCGYCAEHSPRKQWAKRYEQKRLPSRQRGYTSDWDKASKQYLAVHPLCERCEKLGRLTPATLVHHIKRIVEGGEVFNTDNLMALCTECHLEIHKESGHIR